MNDLKYAFRQLFKSPGFTVIAVLTLGLGICVNVTMFDIVRDTVLGPMARDHQLRLAEIFNSREGADRDYRDFTYAELQALQEPSAVFEDVAGFYTSTVAVGRPDDLRRRWVTVVSENYFSVLGVRPERGRFFSAEESLPEASIPVIVANYGFWERLGRPDDFLGSTIRVNKRDYTVIGIAPPGFVGLHVSNGPDAWLPVGEASQLARRDNALSNARSLHLVGNLKPGLSIPLAQTRLPSVNQRINEPNLPVKNGPRVLVLSRPARFSFGHSQPEQEGFLSVFAAIAMGLSSTVLIVACLNLANMQLARGTARQKEIAVRLSLGATRGRVVRQLLVEGLLLSLLGGGVGTLLSLWGGDLIYRIAQESFAVGDQTLATQSAFDLPFVLAIFAFCLIATLASSLGPALRITRPNLVQDLKQVTGESGAAYDRWQRFFSLRNCLVMGQIALSLTLLFSSALFIRAAYNAGSIDLGFQTKNQLVANLDYRLNDLSPDEIARQQKAMLSHATSIPGVEKAALASSVPYNFELPWSRIYPIDGSDGSVAEDESGSKYYAGYTAVSRDYFSMLGITLLRGRSFTDTECALAESPRVAVIDQRLAQALFGEREALGRYVYMGQADARKADSSRAIEIIGIVRSPRNDVFAENPPMRIYRPFGQMKQASIYLHVSTSDPLAMSGPLRKELKEFDGQTPILAVRPLADYVEKNINTLLVNFGGMIIGAIGFIALFLAVVGVYGVKAHAVSRRTREIGIRMALGARAANVLGLILKQGVLQTLVGLGAGVGLSLASAGVLDRMLYKISAHDPQALVACAIVLSIAALVACWLPARRATKVDPMEALRSE